MKPAEDNGEIEKSNLLYSLERLTQELVSVLQNARAVVKGMVQTI